MSAFSRVFWKMLGAASFYYVVFSKTRLVGSSWSGGIDHVFLTH